MENYKIQQKNRTLTALIQKNNRQQNLLANYCSSFHKKVASQGENIFFIEAEKQFLMTKNMHNF